MHIHESNDRKHALHASPLDAHGATTRMIESMLCMPHTDTHIGAADGSAVTKMKLSLPRPAGRGHVPPVVVDR
jgi:hypothetical protein